MDLALKRLISAVDLSEHCAFSLHALDWGLD
jgi:hypothetical protein